MAILVSILARYQERLPLPFLSRLAFSTDPRLSVPMNLRMLHANKHLWVLNGQDYLIELLLCEAQVSHYVSDTLVPLSLRVEVHWDAEALDQSQVGDSLNIAEGVLREDVGFNLV
jgi:hypothetical protein